MTETKFIKMNIPSGKRILVTSDIHGHPELFRRLLDAAGFSDDDLLVIVGDIIEKGPDSLGALREVMRLTGKGNTVALMGNVDLARVDSILRLDVDSAGQFYEYLEEIRSWSHGIWDEMTSELGVFCSSPEEVLAVKDRVLERFRTELDFISGLPTVLETQKYVFVHGGLRDKDIRANASRDARELLKYDDFMTGAPVFDKYVVAGHWPVQLYSDRTACCDPLINRKKRIIPIDGGCGIKEYGQLNMLIIPDIAADVGDICFLAADDLPRAEALEDQAPSEDHINLRWIDNRVETLERFDQYRRIRHLSTGHECLIPDYYMYDDDYATDYSDYLLPVKAGDKLSVVGESPLGYHVKKDGVFGLYRRRIRSVGGTEIRKGHLMEATI